jgi:hypothetical protein
MEPLSIGIPPTFDFTDATPIDMGGISILLVASDYTALATDALCHIEVKTVLLAVG